MERSITSTSRDGPVTYEEKHRYVSGELVVFEQIIHAETVERRLRVGDKLVNAPASRIVYFELRDRLRAALKWQFSPGRLADYPPLAAEAGLQGA